MKCSSCKYWDKEVDEYPCNTCVHNAVERFEPMTNFEKIKAMTLDELAKFIATLCECGGVDPQTDGYVECGNDLCIQRIIKWLKSKVEHG